MRIRLRRSKRIPLYLIWSVFLLLSFHSCKDKKHQIADKESGIIHKVEEGFVQIFNGSTLEGWEGDSTYWRASNGVLIGEVTPETPLESNTFIIWQGWLNRENLLKEPF